MTLDEIQDLKYKVYSIGCSKFPIDIFFNDIKFNKDFNFDKNCAYEDLKLIVDEIYRLREIEKKYNILVGEK